MRKIFRSLIKRDIVRNSLWMFAGRGVRLGIQAIYFVLIARTLDVGTYGAFVGTLALVSILSPFATLGSANLLVKHVSRDHSSFGRWFGNALFLTVTSGVLLVFLAVGISRFVLPPALPLGAIILIAIADVLCFRSIELCGYAFMAFDQLDRMAMINVGASLARLGGVAILAIAMPHPSLKDWAFLYLATTLLAAVVAAVAVVRTFGAPQLRVSMNWADLREGAYFSVGMSSQTVYNDLDKTMLARFSTLEATGIYGIAYRVIDAASAPISSLLSATYSRFFRHGQQGIRSTRRLAIRILPGSVAYGVVIGGLIYALAPWLPVLVGHQYAEATNAIRWLAPLPLFRSLHYFLYDALTGADHQAYRTASQFGVAVLNVGLNLWLLPLYGWRGAAWASLVCEAALLLTAVVMIQMLSARSIETLVPDAAH